MTQQAWEQLTQDLGKRLWTLDDGDTIIWCHGVYYVQCQLATDELEIDAVANHHLPAGSRLSAEQEARMTAMGWQPPRPPGTFNYYARLAMPFSREDSARFAAMIVGALRDVYGLDSPDHLQEKAFNAFQ